MYTIRINNNPRALVNKADTYKNLLAVSKGRKWAGKWYGCVKTNKTTFATREEADREIALLEAIGDLSAVFSKRPTFTIEEI